MANAILSGDVFENTPFRILRRVQAADGSGGTVTGEDGRLILPADVQSITYDAYLLGEVTQPTPLVSGQVVAGAVYTNLQTWTVDNIGYNLAVTIPASVTQRLSNKFLRVVLNVTLTGGATFPLIQDLVVFDVVPSDN